MESHIYLVDLVAGHRQIAGVPESDIERQLGDALGRRLLELRSARGLTQEALAHAAGIARNHYQLLERGINDRDKRSPANPTLSTLVGLSSALGMTADQLVAEILAELS